jgi:hypothetical protein
MKCLEENAFTTYKSRLKAHERIRSRGIAWNIALVALGTATTIASIGLLSDDDMYGTAGEELLVACAVLALSVSLVVSSLDYSARAVRMESSYKECQALAYQMQAARSSLVDDTTYQGYLRRFTDLIRSSENHTTADFHAYKRQFSFARTASAVTSLLPFAFLVVPTWVVIYFVDWVANGL